MQVELLDDGACWLRLRFHNDTDETQWLAKQRGLLGAVPNGGFLDLSPIGSYLGVTAKSRVYAPQALLALPAGQQATSDPFNLRDWYCVRTGQQILARYRAGHPLTGPAVGNNLSVLRSPQVVLNII